MAPRGRGAKSGGALPNLRIFVPQNSLFWLKTAPKPTQDGQPKGNSCYTPRASPLPRDEDLFVALELHDMFKKRPKNGYKWPKCAPFVSNRPKIKNGPYLGLRGSKPNSAGT